MNPVIQQGGVSSHRICSLGGLWRGGLSSGLRLGDLDQIGGHDPPAHPPAEPVFPMLRAASQPVAAFQHADPPLDPGPEPIAAPKPPFPLLGTALRRRPGRGPSSSSSGRRSSAGTGAPARWRGPHRRRRRAPPGPDRRTSPPPTGPTGSRGRPRTRPPGPGRRPGCSGPPAPPGATGAGSNVAAPLSPPASGAGDAGHRQAPDPSRRLRHLSLSPCWWPRRGAIDRRPEENLAGVRIRNTLALLSVPWVGSTSAVA